MIEQDEARVTQADRDFAGDLWLDDFDQPAPGPHDGIAAAMLEGIAIKAARHAARARAEEQANYAAGLPYDERVNVATVAAYESGHDDGVREGREEAARMAEAFAASQRAKKTSPNGWGVMDGTLENEAHVADIIAAAIRALGPAPRDVGEEG